MLRREGADPKVAEMFYRAVTQAVLLFGLNTWVILATMERILEEAEMGFLIKITVKRARWNTDRTWVTTKE